MKLTIDFDWVRDLPEVSAVTVLKALDSMTGTYWQLTTKKWYAVFEAAKYRQDAVLDTEQEARDWIVQKFEKWCEGKNNLCFDKGGNSNRQYDK